MKHQEIKVGDNLYYGGLMVRASSGVHDAVMNSVRRQLKTDQKILEIGSGAGALTRRIHENGFDLVASGIDKDDYRYSEVPFIELNLMEPIESSLNGAFDAIIATEVIEHVENIFLFLRNVRELLAPGGVFIMTTPNATSLFSRLMFLKSSRVAHCNESLMKEWGHIQIIPEWLIRKAAEWSGFECLECQGVGTPRFDLAPFWHKWIHYLALPVSKIIREDYDNQLRGANVLMVLKRVEI